MGQMTKRLMEKFHKYGPHLFILHTFNNKRFYIKFDNWGLVMGRITIRLMAKFSKIRATFYSFLIY